MLTVPQVAKNANKPIEALLKEEYRKYQSQRDMAKALGVKQSNISYWVKRLKLKTIHVLVEENEQPKCES